MRSLLLSSLVASALLGCTYPKIVDRSMLDGGGESDGSNTDTMIQADASADADAAADGSSPDVVAVPDVVVDACVTNGAEVCDGRDNDCDGTVDDVDPATLSSNGMHCGRCGNACTAGAMCQRGFCTVYPSSGADGDFVATAGMTTVLDRARYEYRSFRIPAGATVVLAAGTGVVDIRVQGEVVIEGTLDASGGNGSAAQAAETAGLPYGCNGDFLERKGGGGGGVGGASAPAPNVVSGCAVAAIGNLPADMSGAGANGATGGAVCVGLGGRNGGGGSGSRDGSGGGGGGGAAGGGGGSSLNRATMMDMLAIGSGGTGGSIGMSMGGNGGAGSCTAMACTATGGSAGASPVPYRGTDGESATDMTAPFIAASGGGGGSIGVEAAADLALVRLTPGSSGGGGGSAGRTCNPYGHAYGAGGGGGGGGGAIRITTTTSIRVTGRIAANGGIGGNGGPDSQGGAGGGGSGGAIDLRAPTVTITTDAVIEARGGAGGRAMFAAGAGSTGGNGGAGGLGRIHIATDDPTTACNITASAVRIPFEGMNPCTPSAGAGTAGRVFVSRFSR